jgi:hypothetical protein
MLLESKEDESLKSLKHENEERVNKCEKNENSTVGYIS